MEERLQKLLSRWGIASRRRAEELIHAGRVSVNGKVAELGQKANPAIDSIQLDGQKLSVQKQPEYYYFLLNKPLRVISTCQDPQGRRTVLDLLPRHVRRGVGIHPVGRLDYNSTGALLLTNDGALTYRLTHPRHHIPKTYRVVVAGRPSPASIGLWKQGLTIGNYQTLPAKVDVISTGAKQTELAITLWEGRNRQIRRTADYLGYPVKSLHRVSIGPICLDNLELGQARPVTEQELTELRRATDGQGWTNDDK
ncbi:pseudouridine synthase [Oscillatoria sp. CS-180]|uniref:pseudouridine synthase n=1 Tax=Oscillatoria sp. CS-180 TaxID=3021720 RepID=UPI00232D3AC9|nr:pseudouridine synthase [Oscillatoria sp. CS-180]MDB9526094.1 pseudouridine synthase [Oscillatoria sp. CS-180]